MKRAARRKFVSESKRIGEWDATRQEQKQQEEQEEQEKQREQEQERCGLGILYQIHFIDQFQHQGLLQTNKAPFSLINSLDWKRRLIKDEYQLLIPIPEQIKVPVLVQLLKHNQSTS